MAQPIIELKGITKVFGTGDGAVTALKDVSLTIDEGEIFGVIGLSGAGKSTLVRCINLLEKPTAGTVIVNGKELTKLSERALRQERRRIGMIFQGFNLLQQKSVLDNVCFPLLLAGVGRKEARQKAEKLLKLGAEAFKLRKSKKINIESVSLKYPVLSRLLKSLFVIATLPYCIPVSILTLPIKALLAFLFTKLKDQAFHNSVRYVVNLVLWPLLMIIYAIIAYSLLPWQWALPLTLILLPAPIVAHETWRLMRLAISDIKYIFNKDLQKKHKEIKKLVFNK